MTKKRGLRRPKPLPKFEAMPALDVDEFATAFKFAMNAVADKTILQDPPQGLASLIDEDRSMIDFHLDGNPITRMIVAMSQRYRGNRVKYATATARIMALLNVATQPELAMWANHRDDGTDLHDALVEAAATAILDTQGQFSVPSFVNKVKEISRARPGEMQHYPLKYR